MLLGWLATLAATLAYGVGSVLQAWAATRATGPAVVRHPAYLLGLVCDGLAWAASLVGFRLLPLLVVQAALAGSVAVTAVLGRLVLGTRLRGRDVVAIVFLIVALAGLAVAFEGLGSGPVPARLPALALLGLGLALALLLWGYRSGTSLPLAVLAGASFAGASVCARTVELGSVVSVVIQPVAWSLVGLGAVGTFAYARSLERGPVGPATAVLWAVETVVAGVIGVGVLGDQLRPGAGWPALAAVLVLVLACGVLATGPRSRAEDARATGQPLTP